MTDWTQMSFGLAVSALALSGLSPVGVAYYTHRARCQDLERERIRRAGEQARNEEAEKRRVEVAAEAMKIAQDLVHQSRTLNADTQATIRQLANGVNDEHPYRLPAHTGTLTMMMERELASLQVALATMQATVQAKIDSGIPVLPETTANVLAMQDNIKALCADIRQRKAQGMK